MQALSFVWGCLILVAAVVALIPCLGWLNWFVVPFAAAGAVVCIVAVAVRREGAVLVLPVVGLVLCLLATGIGILRLLLGGGII